jgi:hypothetical protein
MATQYNINDLVKGVNGFGLQFCANNYTVTLGAATEATLTVPDFTSIGTINNNTAKLIAVFGIEPAKKVYVALNAAAAVPVGATLAASTSELNPTAKSVKAGDVIHVISAAAADVSISLYAIQE